MKKILSVVSIIAVSCSVASFAMSQPDWVSGESKKYPKKDYIVGVGIGYNQDAAKSAAQAEIAKIFSLNVQQTATDTNKESTVKKASKKEVENEVSAQTATTVTTSGTLEGVEIADTWFNKKTKNYYALAVLNKSKVKRDLTSQIDDVRKTFNSRYRPEKTPLQMLKRLRIFQRC